MFDFHIHTKVSFDSKEEPKNVIKAAEKLGLREICFTDHYDYGPETPALNNIFTPEDYFAAYNGVASDTVKIRRGVEFGITEINNSELLRFTEQMHFDFVIGSVHYFDRLDPYGKEYWDARTTKQAFSEYLEGTYRTVSAQSGFDVLGHLNYVCKSMHNRTHEPLRYKDYSDISDEIMKVLVARGIGLEINTSGIDRVGDFLPAADYLRRFKELGGEIVTLGSDAHTADRVGQYSSLATDLLKDIFGYVCTFEQRKPIFHKL